MTTHSGKQLIERMNAHTPAPGSLAVWWLGQMGIAVKGLSDVLYVDPYLTGKTVAESPPGTIFAREFPPPLLPDEVSNAQFVLCSHEHGDHTDSETLRGIAAASPGAIVVHSGWAQAQIDQAGLPAARCIVARSAPLRLGEFTVTPVPSAHYTRENDPVKGERWLGFLIEGNGVRLYHTGDTIIFDGYVDALKALPRPDLVVACSNGRDARRDALNITGNLMPVEAVWLARELGWDTLIFGHNDLFAFNSLQPGALAEAVAVVHPRQKWHTLQPGELFVYAAQP